MLVDLSHDYSQDSWHEFAKKNSGVDETANLE